MVNIFSTGPASDAWVVRSLRPVERPLPRSAWAPVLSGAPPAPGADDDNEVAFFIPPLLLDATEVQHRT